MTLFVNKLTSFDVYAKYPLGQVLETDTLDDVCSGMNPCYYMLDGDRLKVSSSVVSLILDSGRFELNPDFKPPKFFCTRGSETPWISSAEQSMLSRNSCAAPRYYIARQ